MPTFNEFPTSLRFERKSFDIGYKQQVNPEAVGFIQTIDRLTPMWWAEYTSVPIPIANLGVVQAFFDSLEGAMNTIQAWDPDRIMPLAYRGLSPDTNDPWTQTGQTSPRVTARDYTASTLTIDRLENGAIITAGDLISFYDGVGWHLYRAAANYVVASNTATVLVKPRPRTAATLPANVRYRRACFEGKILGGVKWTSSVGVPDTVTFKVAQFINRTV